MKILIFDPIYVPGYGMGPFNSPIEIEDPALINMIKKNSRIKVIGGENMSSSYCGTSFPIRVSAKTKQVVTEALKEEVVVETPVVEEVVVETPVVEEVVVETPVVGDGILDTEEELKELTINELKAKLDEMGVSYAYKDTKTTLIQKILENM